MALGECALEMLYVVAVLKHLGHEFEYDSAPELETSKPEAHKALHKALATVRHGEGEVQTDRLSAFDLVNSSVIGANSRHIERKAFKMKELRHRKIAKVTLIPTAENSADLLTKALDTVTFKKHRAAIMNLRA